MKISDLILLYNKKKEKYGKEAYRHISNLLREAKAQHKLDFNGMDHEQSWRAFKGKNLEKLIEYIITDEVKSLGLEVVNGNLLERTKGENLSKELSLVKRNLLIDYGEFGSHLPDVDIIIYDPTTSKVVAVLSSKVTLRERIAQTGYWKIKLASDKVTQHIKVYFVTPDEDGTLTTKIPTKKGRAIVESDLDGSYVLSEVNIEESTKVKMFDKFIDDLKNLIK
ncbi:MAG TPA: BsaWI family type II restriction enzyme [Candidatus Kapabacteria bacterium]|jgi:type II restriction enzyme|nr:DNA modification methylase [Candidatus Kapabacteria bacterium]HOV92616.1 BsaWI family type II restriction enzyme [Candidatus Kapabacteria bacterium]